MIYRVWFALAAGLLELVVVSSPRTPQEIAAAVESVPVSSDIALRHEYITVLDGTQRREWAGAVAVLDYSYDAGVSVQLLETPSLVVCMYTGCPEQELQSMLLPQEYGEGLAHFLVELGLEDAFLIGDSDTWDLGVVGTFNEQQKVTFNQVGVLGTQMSDLEITRFVGQVVKPAGTNLAVCVLQPAPALSLVRALRDYHLLESGFAYVFSQRAMWQLFGEDPALADGLLFVGDSATALAKTRTEYEQLLLVAQVQALAEAVMAGQSSAREFLASAYGGKSRNCSLALVNVQHSSPTFRKPFSFPGNSTVLPKLTEATIYVSGDYSGLNSDGSIYPDGSSIVRGFVLANEEVNERHDILPHFLLVNNSVSLGVVFDNAWALQQIPRQRGLLGAAFHAVPLSQNVLGITEDFRVLNISIPIVTTPGSSRLSDPKEYPLFLRTISSSLYSATVMARFFRLFGWKQTAFIYSPAEEDVDYYRCFLAVSAQYDVHITNSDTSRMIPLSLPAEQLNATLAEILESTVRVIIVSHLFTHFIAERMYDLGARAGDYLLLAPYGLSETYYAGNEESSRKRREVAKGAMMFFSDLFVGPVGQSVKHRMAAGGEKVYPQGCAFYDSVMLVAYALDFMVARGLHYENGSELVRVMRGTRFEGCIGHVQIESGTNDKIPGDYVIINMQVDFSNVTFRNVARYSPFKTQLFNFTGAIQWPDGGSSFPDSWARLPQCPYYVREVRDFPKGRLAGVLACFAFALIAVTISVGIWLKKRAQPTDLLHAPALISVEDVLMLLTEPIDFLEMAAIGPTACLNKALKVQLGLSILVFEPILNFSHGAFWAAEVMALSFAAVYLLLCVVKRERLESALLNVCVIESICSWLDLLLPTVSSAMFLPVVYTFLSTFSCFQSTGPKFTDSFLSRDCHERCWQGSHATYSTLAAVSLLLYTPAAVLTRPLWQGQQSSLHVKANPSHLAAKSAVQVLLAAASAALRGESSHAIVYFCTISFYLVLGVCTKAYNYNR